MGVFQSSDPTEWGSLDGIYIDETSPPPSVTGVPANVALLVGQFERGSTAMQSVGSAGQLYELYGNNIAQKGNIALQNKKFGLLKIIRVVASGAAAATHAFVNASSSSAIAFTALWKGAYGNAITVTVAAGSTTGSKYTVHDGNANAVWPDEVYDNVVITSIAGSNPFTKSNLIVGTALRTDQGEPSTASATALGSGSDGSVADSDYLTAIGLSEVANSANIIFLDEYTTARKGYVKNTLAATEDKMGVINDASGTSASAAITDVASYRDTDGRIIYAFPWVWTTINGISTLVAPSSFYAAMLSQIAPSIDPAYAANTQYLGGIESLELNLTRTDYKNLMAAGISAFEIDSDIGPKVKSGVVTQIVNSAKVMIFRRRMADYLIQSLAKFLKNYQNAPNSKKNRDQVGGAITSFNRLLETSGLVPSDAEVNTGKASLIDTASLNTDDSIAAGYFKLIYKRRIYSSMRFIVLQADISEGVVVTEVG